MKKPVLKSDLRNKVLISLALLLFTALAYWNIARAEFVNLDDHVYVLKNEVVQQGLSVEGVRWAFSSGWGGNWHPVTWLSHMLDVQLFGLKPGAHHLVNLFFHLVNTLLLFLLFCRITGALWRSAFVAALFALHPLHVESVAWVAERKDLLSTLFGLLTIWFYARSIQSVQKSAMIWNHLVSLLFFALGLMCKPMLVTVPCLLLLLDYWPLGRFRIGALTSKPVLDTTPALPLDARLAFRLVAEKSAFFALAIASCVITFIVQKNSGAMASLGQLSLSHRAGNAAVAYASYLEKMIWPRDLAILYPIQSWPLWQIIAAATLLLLISIVAVKLALRRPYFLTGWLWFVGMLVPVIGLVHVGSQSMADRYTYLPMVGILVLVAWGAFDLLRGPGWRWLGGSLALAVIGSCFVFTRAQVAYWKNSETLFQHALRSTKNNVVLQSALASQYVDEGRMEEAFALLSEAVATNPNDADVQNNFGYVLLTHGQVEKSVAHFQVALRCAPEFAEANYNMGNALFLQGRPADALPFYEKAVLHRPDYAQAEGNLARTYLLLGQPEKAFPHAQTAVRLKPDFLQARDTLGKLHLQRGHLTEAEECFRRLIELQPGKADYADSLGLVMMAQKNFADASAQFSKAIALDPRQSTFHYHLGNALWESHQTVPARQAYRTAITIQPDYAEAHYQLAMILMSEGKMDDAAQQLATAVKSKPEWPEALNNLAWILATDKDASVRNGAEATRLAEKALQLGGATASNLDTLAAAYAEAGNFEPAVTSAKKAVALANASSQTKMAQEISTRLQAYENKTPWREP